MDRKDWFFTRQFMQQPYIEPEREEEQEGGGMADEYHVIGTYRSSSRRNLWYRVSVDEKGGISCTCPGWCRRTASDGSRSCRHTNENIPLALEVQRLIRRGRDAAEAVRMVLGMASTSLSPRQVSETLNTSTPVKGRRVGFGQKAMRRIVRKEDS